MRKGQVGTTLTWFFAIVIIFGMSLLFVLFSALSGGAQVDFSDKSINNIRLNHELNFILNYPVSDTETIQDLIVDWGEEIERKRRGGTNIKTIDIKNEIESYFDKFFIDSWEEYKFQVEYVVDTRAGAGDVFAIFPEGGGKTIGIATDMKDRPDFYLMDDKVRVSLYIKWEEKK